MSVAKIGGSATFPYYHTHIFLLDRARSWALPPRINSFTQILVAFVLQPSPTLLQHRPYSKIAVAEAFEPSPSLVHHHLHPPLIKISIVTAYPQTPNPPPQSLPPPSPSNLSSRPPSAPPPTPAGLPVPPSLDNKVQVTQRFPYRRPTPLSF